MNETEIQFMKDRIVELERYKAKGIREVAFPFDKTFSIETMIAIFNKTLNQINNK